MQEQSPQIAGAYAEARTLAVWPSLKAASRIALIFAAGAVVGITWSPGSPLRDVELPAFTLPALSLPIGRVPETVSPPPIAVQVTEPAAPAAPIAGSPVVEVPAPAPARPAWQAPDVPRVAFTPRVERWRPLVRQIMAEMWDEGRLDGYAASLDDDLVLALIQQESAGSANATSWVGAIGLMQVMPFTFAEMLAGDKALADQIDPADMYDLTSNVRAGLRYLALAMQATEGNLYWSLAAYNGGIEAVDAWRAVGLYAVPPIGGYEETANYAQIILRNYVAHRPDVQVHIPDPMPYEHLPGAVEALLEAGRY